MNYCQPLNNENPCKNFDLTCVEFNQVTLTLPAPEKDLTKQSVGVSPLSKGRKKAKVTFNKSQGFNRLVKHSAAKILLILSILVTISSPTIAPSSEKGMSPIDVRIQASTHSSDRQNERNMTKNVSPFVADQHENQQDVNTSSSKFPSVEYKMRECRLSWRQAEDEDDFIDQIPPPKKGPDEPPPPDKKPAQSPIPDLLTEMSKSPANPMSKSPVIDLSAGTSNPKNEVA